CSGCGAYVRKDLSVRVHCCPVCGLVLDRDVNAARNVLKRGLGLGLGQADFMPVGGVAAARLGGVEQVVSVSQEARLL
ncbi:MAG: zinc ribbon domain-containing protein, partial [Candidatus Bathyarchaeota archaeon]|nr:zinc ribbon domain-containing protein [Candidatus Bathyarchaeota archaeon]